MEHLRKLGSFGDYDYVYFNKPTPEMMKEFNRMFAIIQDNGHALTAEPWPVDAGILLTDGKITIAGAFFNISKHKNSILLHLIFVDEEFRRQRIYTEIQKLLTLIGKFTGKKKLYSYIHVNNKVLTDHIMPLVGYVEVMKLVTRDL
jgi:hypothetical protein